MPSASASCRGSWRRRQCPVDAVAIQNYRCPLILLCHNLPIVRAALAAGAPQQLACKSPGDGDADGGDGGLHMAFRPDREIRGAGNLWVAKAACRMALAVLPGGKNRPSH